MERNCSLLLHYDVKNGGLNVLPSEDDLRKNLESSDVQNKLKGLKTLILLILNGYSFRNLLMTVIRYCVNVRNHELKKLLYIYWEVVEKYDEKGNLLPEMILVCNSILTDLKHPNHYIRGYTLRFLCRIKDAEILQPLLSTILDNLMHNETYVKKYSILFLYNISKNKYDIHLPMSVEDISSNVFEILNTDGDDITKRNCILYLDQCDYGSLLRFYDNNLNKIPKYSNHFKYIFLKIVRKICKETPQEKPRFLKTIFQMLTSTSSGSMSGTANAVIYEAALTLVSLSSAPIAIRSATTAFINLLNNSESDNNVRLIVLGRLEKLKNSEGCGKIVQENVLDILRVLKVPNRDIRKKTLQIAMELVSPRNIKEIVTILKKQIVQTQSKEIDREEAEEYRQELIKSIHDCAVKYPSIASSVIHLLMDFLTVPELEQKPKGSAAGQGASGAGTSMAQGAQNASGGLEVILFVREIVETYPKLREDIIGKLIFCLPDITASDVLRVSLWLLGEYSVEIGKANEAVEAIYEAMGNKFFTLANASEEDTAKEGEAGKEEGSAAKSNTVTILADGTYATQTAATMQGSTLDESNATKSKAKDDIIESLIKSSDPQLRKLIIRGNYMLASCVVSSLMKLILKLKNMAKEGQHDMKEVTRHVVKCVKLSCSLLNFGRAKELPPNNQMDKDSYERINLYIKVLLDGSVEDEVGNIVLTDSRNNLQKLLNEHKKSKQLIAQKEEKSKMVQPDQVILFRQLKSGQRLGVSDELDDENDLNVAITAVSNSEEASGNVGEQYRKELKNIYQLTGFGDPVYAEANVTVHGFDIIIDVLVINKSKHTMVDLNVELATLGDLKLVESSQGINLSPNDFHSFKTNMKVSSTESAQIFGTIVYDDSSTKETTYINLDYINVDIMDYIKPATCSDEDFRRMWAEFEWENKVAVNTRFNHLYKFLHHIVAHTNMNCLNIKDLSKKVESIIKAEKKNGELGTEAVELVEDFDFLAANLYAKSIFGEDALVNISVEKVGQDKVEGFIRIRAKTQGIALSLGDRINLKQKNKS